ncbi:MAG: hypothetical protein M1539_06490 [Actinobacteria bacterium]|nr:hypothetical protein [Actinomycetota bacterium]MCL5883603.1 hypothetical protein [Actinomycetota bacterium]
MKTAAALATIILLALGSWGCAFAASSPSPTPHAVTGSYENCSSCHEDGSQGAPRTDHPRKADCTSCHHPAKQ